MYLRDKGLFRSLPMIVDLHGEKRKQKGNISPGVSQ